MAIFISVGFARDARRSVDRSAAIELHGRVGQVFAPMVQLAQTLQQGGRRPRTVLAIARSVAVRRVGGGAGAGPSA